jgi:hypothetical protein
MSGSVAKVKVKVNLEQATKVQRLGRGMAFLKLGTRWGWVVNASSRPLYPLGRIGYPFYRRLGRRIVGF